jgi:FMN phosphatase YigB (HAD superfamily)
MPAAPLPAAWAAIAPRPQISHVVFDFDGTLSWIRHGWPAIMLQVMRERLPCLRGEGDAQVDALLSGIIIGLNGKPTILQMMRFAELVRERSGRALDPETLRAEYQRRLDAEIAARAAQMRGGHVADDHYVVHGARALLEKLRSDGLKLYVLSSTVEERVREEAELLGLTRYFDGRINGCVGAPTRFSKRGVFERILREDGISGDRLLSFGDGPVELSDTKELGGRAIAVCSDEDHNGSGVSDPHKERQLLAAGADLAIPDYRDAIALVDHLRRKA